MYFYMFQDVETFFYLIRTTTPLVFLVESNAYSLFLFFPLGRTLPFFAIILKRQTFETSALFIERPRTVDFLNSSTFLSLLIITVVIVSHYVKGACIRESICTV